MGHRLHIVLGFVATCVFARVAGAGINNTPLPTFSDGKPARLAYALPALVKVDNLETVVFCTSFSNSPMDIGFEVFDEAGRLANDISVGNGSDVGFQPGATITFATGDIAVLQENRVISLTPPVSAPIAKGSGRIVVAGGSVFCTAYVIDALHTVVDPAVDPTVRAPVMRNLTIVNAVPCDPAACNDGNDCTTDSCDDFAGCLNQPVLDGTPCDDANLCTTDDSCTSGLCDGTDVVCGNDTPCNVTAVCNPGTGLCEATNALSTCVPGGGPTSSDCVAEWVVDNPSNPSGVTSKVQVCNQGDNSCDFDLDDRVCTFRVRLCLNNHDVNLPACVPGDVLSYQLTKPPTRGAQKAIADDILGAVAGLGGSTRGGRKQSVVTFDPVLGTADTCTDEIAIPVRRKKALALATRTTTSAAAKDGDTLRLVCKVPKPPRAKAR